MTTITIDNPIIEKKYSASELQKKFIVFMQTEIEEDKIDLYEVSVSDLEKKSQDRLKNIDSLNFVEY